MRKRVLILGMVGCSDYQVSKRSTDAVGEEEVVTDTADPEPLDPPVDTGEPEDSGDDGIVEDPPEDTGVDMPVEPVYVHTDSTLYSLDPSTGTLSLIGDFNDDPGGTFYGSMTDIAIDSEGNFYGIGFTALYGIDPTTARVWDIAPMAEAFVGLTATSDGRLIGAGDGLYEIDVVTGGTTPLVDAGVYQTSGDIVGLPSSLLYWLVRSEDETGDLLVEVDATSGANRVVGSVGVSNLFGVGYSEASLYGFSETGLMVEIDPTSAAVLSESSLGPGWWGAATNPVVW